MQLLVLYLETGLQLIEHEEKKKCQKGGTFGIDCPLQCGFHLWDFLQDSGNYWKKVAATYYTIRSELIDKVEKITPSYKSMVIFDIDETLLSNMDEIKKAGYGKDNQLLCNLVLDYF